ncbi:type IV pilus modification protein PilV [Rhodanobacter sp. DHG33]|uniref:type IV pilus modification protein PilV n=1 Tax=Rhodanobacter sp. DHG33 TaxID=2775921 RepID=UPI001786693A|nr:type IV pilus modification protein PilV [Rhodanobacter sp. DHG33]MBD8898108.1 type IV pilus modification protein PilV [Rhodanobacter sp. DHG33]
MRSPIRQRGVSLIEVLVAVMIFSIGLIGLAGLLIMSTRSNQAAYLRTQVAFLAQNMADRMSANPMAVWDGTYNSSSYPIASTGASCVATSPCTPDDLATYDMQTWSTQLTTFLPSAKATINCDASSAGYTPTSAQYGMRPPYGGNCTMTITWTERGVGDSTHSAALSQVFTWEFQP